MWICRRCAAPQHWENFTSLRWPQPQRYDCHSNLFWDPAANDYLATTRDGFSHGSGRDIGMARSLPGKFAWSTVSLRQPPAAVSCWLPHPLQRHAHRVNFLPTLFAAERGGVSVPGCMLIVGVFIPLPPTPAQAHAPALVEQGTADHQLCVGAPAPRSRGANVPAKEWG